MEKIYKPSKEDKQKSHIEIPQGYTGIPDYAFRSFLNLQSISLPDSVTSIGIRAFAGCSNLQSISLPDSVTSIGICAFAGCSNLQSVFLPENLTSIEYSAFEGCSSLQSISIPDSVTFIGSSAFEGCLSLQSISIPDSVTSIDDYTFYGCSNLQSISLPENLTSINYSAFRDCSNLQSISIPDGVTSIGGSAFAGCSNLQSVSIPDSVTSIGICAFEGCSRLYEFDVHLNNKKIKSSVDKKCLIDQDGKLIAFAPADIKYYKIPNNVTSIGKGAFRSCSSLQSISLPESLTIIGAAAFRGCSNLQSISLPKNLTSIEAGVFEGCSTLKNIILENGVKNIEIESFKDVNIQYIYFDKKNNNVILSTQKDPSLEKTCLRKDFTAENYCLAMNQNYKDNFIQLSNWKDEKKIKFIPPEFTLKIFPNSQLRKYFVNNNNQRWGKLVKTLGFDTLDGTEKNNSLTDLMKIYYAIGGFSENQGESEKAYEYILKYVAVSKNPNATPQEIGQEIHSRFSKITLNGEYCKEFAQFFMKYYKTNPDFMNFRLKDIDGDLMDSADYLCNAHNSFKTILKNYPNRVVNGNEERALLTPRFVAEHCSIIEYEDVEEGNELLAETVGKYGYSQVQFDRIQEIYNKAKKIKDKYVIEADKSLGTNGIYFRILEKDDPLGFVIGDITNCCQHIDGAADSCVDDGYTNPEAGFIVFEEHLTNENGNPIDKTRILGQAYVWYDSKTKTVCLDNIEIPHKVLRELRSKAKDGQGISSEDLISVVKECAESIMKKMNEKEVKVERVTVGKGYNDLTQELSQHFKQEINPKAKNKSGIYTDAGKVQYLIATYDDFTKKMANNIQTVVGQAKADIEMIRSNQNGRRFGE